MPLFLDAHVSGPRIGRALRAIGYDVRAVDEERELDGLDDADLFELAVADRRILVTFNVKDFLPILRAWAEQGRAHAGCILVASSLRHEDFGILIAGIRRILEAVPDQDAWVDRTDWLSKSE